MLRAYSSLRLGHHHPRLSEWNFDASAALLHIFNSVLPLAVTLNFRPFACLDINFG